MSLFSVIKSEAKNYGYLSSLYKREYCKGESLVLWWTSTRLLNWYKIPDPFAFNEYNFSEIVK